MTDHALFRRLAEYRWEPLSPEPPTFPKKTDTPAPPLEQIGLFAAATAGSTRDA